MNFYFIEIKQGKIIVEREDKERCGYFFIESPSKKKLSYYVDNTEEGSFIKDDLLMKYCLISSNRSMYWHTHPKNEVWIISAGDVLQCLIAKTNVYHGGNVSIQFNKFGIFEMFAKRTFNLNEEWSNIITDLVNTIWKDFYIHGKINFETFLNAIDVSINNLLSPNEKVFYIYFNAWENTKDDKYYLKSARDCPFIFFEGNDLNFIYNDNSIQTLKNEGKINLN